LVENEKYLTNNFVIFPNPNDGKFKINLENAIDVIKIEILNSAGAVVYAEYYNENIGESIEVEAALVPGLYILRLIGLDKTYLGKMVVE
ncbi:MAG: T9SS type A sorting domain-containing protein, partial [Bacteroidales bacterium]|nr:T9SS type A sorting domain-containing protein [Bacteroidales bacterium]